MTDRLLALRAFVRAAHSGSFSRAGRELGLSQPSVSRILAQLEQEVGAALLMRTTRRVTLTDAGADYLARIEPLLAGLEEAEHAARGTGELRGMLRIALSSSFGVREVIPRLPGFLERHPALHIDIGVNDARQDCGRRDRRRATPRLAAQLGARVEETRASAVPAVASAVYLDRRGRPRDPADLAGHAVIVGPGGAGHAWTFIKGGRRASIRVEGRLTTAANKGAIAAATPGWASR